MEAWGNKEIIYMSLVIAAISKDNDIIVCGEGRSVNPITDEILAEDTIKAFKLNSSLIIAYVGNDTKTTPLKVHLLKLCINYYKTWDVENIYKEALKYEKENHKVENGELQFLAAGYDDNNNPHLYVIGANKTAVGSYDYCQEKTVSIGNMDYVLYFDKENDDANIIESKIISTIKEKAKIDPVINDNITCKLHISLSSQHLD